MSKECETKRSCPPADSNYASDRTANMMYEMRLFRESKGLTPAQEITRYRRPELKKLNHEQDYSLEG